MGGAVPKQFLALAGRTILDRTLATFIGCPLVDGIVLALPPQTPDDAKASYRSLTKMVAVVDGGPERPDSVRNALAAAPPDTEIVLVHDAVRPFVSEGLIGRCADLAREHGAVVPVVPIRDTVKEWDRAG